MKRLFLILFVLLCTNVFSQEFKVCRIVIADNKTVAYMPTDLIIPNQISILKKNLYVVDISTNDTLKYEIITSWRDGTSKYYNLKNERNKQFYGARLVVLSYDRFNLYLDCYIFSLVLSTDTCKYPLAQYDKE